MQSRTTNGATEGVQGLVRLLTKTKGHGFKRALDSSREQIARAPDLPPSPSAAIAAASTTMVTTATTTTTSTAITATPTARAWSAIRTIRVCCAHRLIGFVAWLRMSAFERNRLTGWNFAAFATFHLRALLTQNRFARKSNAIAFDR